MAASFSVKFGIEQVQGLAEKLAHLDEGEFGTVALRGVNEAATIARETAIDRMSGINLTREYMQRKLELRPATNAVRPVAVIRAGVDLTNLRSYSPRQLTRVVRYTNADIASRIGTLGPNPRKLGSLAPFTRRIGAAALGIPVGRKQAGLTVEVTRGSPKPIAVAFVITPKATGIPIVVKNVGPGGKNGKKGKVKSLTAPSVYQLFRHTLDPKFLQGVQATLSNTVVTFAESALRKALL